MNLKIDNDIVDLNNKHVRIFIKRYLGQYLAVLKPV